MKKIIIGIGKLAGGAGVVLPKRAVWKLGNNASERKLQIIHV
jgi:hypothetical protein